MEEILKRYPLETEGGITIRPLQEKDESGLVELFKRIPVDERYFFKDDVTDPVIVKGWCTKLDYENVFPLIALDGDRVVADASLHRDRRGWGRHVARVRIALDPDYRRKGLAKTLIKEFIEVAPRLKIAIFKAEILTVQSGGIKLFEDLGFHCVATLPHHAIDLNGKVRDIAVYSLGVTPAERLAPEASVAEEDADVGGSG